MMSYQRYMPPTGALKPVHTRENHELTIRQQPERAKVIVRGREKERKPIDPPPILQLHVNDPYNTVCSYLHNPYYFCSCYLWEPAEDRAKTNPDTSNTRLKDCELLQGQTVSSLHRLKDINNEESAFFVFGDISCAILGKFRLKFCLWEMDPVNGYVILLKDILSETFECTTPKEWEGQRESTALSRTFADQGVKLRLRKESRHSKQRNFNPQVASSSLAPQTPIRPQPSGSYGSVSSPEGEPVAKRQRSFPNTLPTTSSMASYGSGSYGPLYSQSAAQFSQPPFASAGGSYSNYSTPQMYQRPSWGAPSPSYSENFPPTQVGESPAFTQSYPQHHHTSQSSSEYDMHQNQGFSNTGFAALPHRPNMYQPQPHPDSSFYNNSMYQHSMANPSGTPRLNPIRGPDNRPPGSGGSVMPSIEKDG